MQDCSACPLSESSQQPHSKHAVYGVSRAFQIVFIDTLGPITPTALGGFKYAAKFVDQQTKWKEGVLMKDKTCSTDALELFNKGTVIPRSERIHVLRANRVYERRLPTVLPGHRHPATICIAGHPPSNRSE